MFTKVLVRSILERAAAYDWTLQGLGMIRLYLEPVGRLHIWDSAMKFPNVSKLHNHSWDLSSQIIVGEIRNTRFTEVPGDAFWKQRLVCGISGGQMASDPVPVGLHKCDTEVYTAGQTYAQKAHEVHFTDALPGTVTLMARQHDGPMGEADVFWEKNKLWGTAMPRPASSNEVKIITQKALKLFL